MEQRQGGASREHSTEPIFGPDDLTIDTGGQLRPLYAIVPRSAGQLACGELAVEPILGPARVAAITTLRQRTFGDSVVRVTWIDDHGSSSASGQYQVDRVFLIRVAGPTDRFTIRQSLGRAARLDQDIGDGTARLIAAHLHTGPRSALYDFAIDGAIRDRLFEELDVISRRRPYARSWVHALGRYCVGRDHFGPLEGWTAIRGTAWATRQAMRRLDTQAKARREAASPDGDALGEEFVEVELARRLIDAAFDLGTLALRRDVLASSAYVRLLHRATSRRADINAA